MSPSTRPSGWSRRTAGALGIVSSAPGRSKVGSSTHEGCTPRSNSPRRRSTSARTSDSLFPSRWAIRAGSTPRRHARSAKRPACSPTPRRARRATPSSRRKSRRTPSCERPYRSASSFAARLSERPCSTSTRPSLRSRVRSDASNRRKLQARSNSARWLAAKLSRLAR